MHLLADTVADKLSDDSIAMPLTMLLDSITDITETLAVDGILNSYIERFLRDFQQAAYLFADLTYTECISRITAKPIHVRSTIHRYNITFFQDDIARDAMYHLLVD